ncbi:hypothetical protein J5X84_41815 [Streptosporangiaceae bacterium NEAU-GS5]|nr:hypothetical protein [Streptosporangiaceae bacterium NEAU-GS5]
MVIGGLILVPFPGPGWLIVFLGLALLATEFAWAQGVLGFARRQVGAATDWIKRQSWPIRILAGVLTAALALTIVWASLKFTIGFDLIDQARQFVDR